MWSEPKDVARGVYESSTPLERERIKKNLSCYGNAIFKKFNYSKQESEEFITELSRLLHEPLYNTEQSVCK